MQYHVVQYPFIRHGNVEVPKTVCRRLPPLTRIFYANVAGTPPKVHHTVEPNKIFYETNELARRNSNTAVTLY